MVEEVKHAAEAAEAIGPIARLGVDWKLLVAQLFNFGVVIFVMWRWVYRPLQKVMDERTAKIEKGLEDAKNAAQARESATTEKEQVIADARLQAKEIIDEAERLSRESRDEQVTKTREEVEAIVKKGKSQLQADKDAMLADARAEVADVVVAAAEKVIAVKIDSKKDTEMVKRALSDLNK
jgi:F-type H+-transporting ATPase subunit b